jgi:carboxyl-terminal processing protease
LKTFFTKPSRLLWIPIGAVVLLFTGAAVSDNDVYFKIKKNFTIFSEVFTEISLRYVDDVDPENLMMHGLEAMLETLDPYTVLIDDNQNQQMDIMTTGKYAGVGLDIGIRQGEFVVISPMEGYSAYRRGVRAGDVITHINEIEVKELTSRDLEGLMYGEPGSEITITVQRYGVDESLHFTLTRERIDVNAVRYFGFLDEDQKLGYISLSQFSQNASEEVRSALVEFKKAGTVEGVILDLRNNPGGLLDEAVGLVDKFIGSDQEVVSIKGRIERNNQAFFTSEPPVFDALPVVVLQNEGSASASEIVAGALQDFDRAVILGQSSFGKGLVQTVKPTSYNNALKITTSKYYIPSGRSIQKLEYNHATRNSSSIIPDSLRTEFKTRNGRSVFDGIGIEPDIYLTPDDNNPLLIALLQQGHYFRFANQIVAETDTVTWETIEMDVYPRFLTYLNEVDFSYSTKTEQRLEQLIREFEKIETSVSVEEEVQILRNKIDEYKTAQLTREEMTLKRELYKELLHRFVENEYRYPLLLQKDEMIDSARSILFDTDRYNSILSPESRR